MLSELFQINKLEKKLCFDEEDKHKQIDSCDDDSDYFYNNYKCICLQFKNVLDRLKTFNLIWFYTEYYLYP